MSNMFDLYRYYRLMDMLHILNYECMYLGYMGDIIHLLVSHLGMIDNVLSYMLCNLHIFYYMVHN